MPTTWKTARSHRRRDHKLGMLAGTVYLIGNIDELAQQLLWWKLTAGHCAFPFRKHGRSFVSHDKLRDTEIYMYLGRFDGYILVILS